MNVDAAVSFVATYARVLRGTPRPDGMMAGLAANVDAVLFIGYHGKAGTPGSVLAHTISGRVIADVRCNGRSLGELGLNSVTSAGGRSGMATRGVKALLRYPMNALAADQTHRPSVWHRTQLERMINLSYVARCLGAS